MIVAREESFFLFCQQRIPLLKLQHVFPGCCLWTCLFLWTSLVSHQMHGDLEGIMMSMPSS